MTTHLNCRVGTTLEEPLHKAQSLDKSRFKCRSILCLIGIAITLQLPQEQICPCLHQQSNNLRWTFLEQKEHYLTTNIWRSQNILPPYSDSAWIPERLKGPQIPSICSSGPGNNARMWRSWVKNLEILWLLSSKQSFQLHITQEHPSLPKPPSFSISALSLVSLLISLRFLTPRNYGFNCLQMEHKF